MHAAVESAGLSLGGELLHCDGVGVNSAVYSELSLLTGELEETKGKLKAAEEAVYQVRTEGEGE